ncbi:uncharacterized protein CCOS01_04343 [Colletotrichum costaricense]|uniref:Uncharacterized protein n=1 Tax=Colletotrichum costaricense TaxID=1209916 RepID=A0AAI9Z2M1_9PEZI|nr:uncharacterized protein CCOS01_04343 [Colletotrichum costaricense]KAK1532360.1 hypothetical protein CCOS01_04343 [Colletotrichum costaricense]
MGVVTERGTMGVNVDIDVKHGSRSIFSTTITDHRHTAANTLFSTDVRIRRGVQVYGYGYHRAEPSILRDNAEAHQTRQSSSTGAEKHHYGHHAPSKEPATSRLRARGASRSARCRFCCCVFLGSAFLRSILSCSFSSSFSLLRLVFFAIHYVPSLRSFRLLSKLLDSIDHPLLALLLFLDLLPPSKPTSTSFPTSSHNGAYFPRVLPP